MSAYDFRALDDKEFESLCADVIGTQLNVRIERFRPGRDRGVDGRYFADSSREVILQCKHWAGTSTKTLIRRLEDELPKVKRLNPSQYLVATSQAFSHEDKRQIAAIFANYTTPADIYAAQDLNDILEKHVHLVERHYKLWLQSASVLRVFLGRAIVERSRALLEEVRERSNKYVPTVAYEQAQRKLNEHGVVIITGEPGVGKTTLAEQLCLLSAADGFDLRVIGEEIREAEEAFDDDSRQAFYFDDFLGTNYLQALSGHEGSHIARFIKRVRRSKNKRFILTSRTTILNQGKALIDKLHKENIERDEFEITIRSLSAMERARILYSHLWHSGLSKDHIEAIYVGRRYREIIGHQNFNPRLISFVTDASRLAGVPAETYWNWITQALNNPSEIWENPFTAQHDDYGRAIVLLVGASDAPIEEATLNKAYERLVAIDLPGDSRSIHNLEAAPRLIES